MKTLNYKFHFSVLLIFLFAGGVQGCRKLVTIPPPETSIVAETVFSNDESAASTMSGLYSRMTSLGTIFTNGGMSIFPGLSADELYPSVSNATYNPYVQNAISPSELTTNYNRFWSRAYQFIYHANAILEGVESSGGITKSLKQQMKGEAKFLRAFYYFTLVNLYGDVPLVTSTDYRSSAATERTPSALVYQQMEQDLLEAVALLPTRNLDADKSRPNKWAATALLARVYLYQQKWAQAEASASALLHSGTYELETNLNHVFLVQSKEAIWQLLPVLPSRNTEEGFLFIPSTPTTRPVLAVRNELLNIYEPNDQRAKDWLKSVRVANQTFYYPFKYKVKSGTAVTELNTVLRLAELYLIRAEARAQQHNYTDALKDLNVIRERAGLPPAIAFDLASLQSAIERERRLELAVEWGHRWLDLKRWDKADAILGPIKGSQWQPTDILYPIPLNQIQVNPILIQNPGY